MKKKPVIAILGATGLVGNEIVVLLDEKKTAFESIRLFASEESVGEYYKIGEEEVTVELLSEDSLDGVDIAISALPPELTQKHAERAKTKGVVLIDTSSATRIDPSIPLVVHGVNEQLLGEGTTVIATPRSPVVQLAPVLLALNKESRIKRIVLSTYQAVSSAGKGAVDELWEQTRSIFIQKEMPHEAFQHQIAFNTIPQIDVMSSTGDTREEEGVIAEVRRVLGDPELAMSVTCVRVPVLHSDALSVNIEFVKDITPERAGEILEKVQTLRLYRDPSEYPMQIDSANSEEIHVGRIRRDSSVAHGLNLWVVADNIRRGVALNAIEILGSYIERFGKA